MENKKDIDLLKEKLISFPKDLDGKECILEMKENNSRWKDMEWLGFYFEYKCCKMLIPPFKEGDKFGNVQFDLKKTINWDLKTLNIEEDRSILNDIKAMDASIEKHSFHGEIIGVFEVQKDNKERSFQEWHDKIKGKKSKYVIDREKRTSTSRIRKISGKLKYILLIIINKENLSDLIIHRQGRNSNGLPREPKYMLDLKKILNFNNYKIEF